MRRISGGNDSSSIEIMLLLYIYLQNKYIGLNSTEKTCISDTPMDQENLLDSTCRNTQVFI
jgi:hypothetical protein